MSDTSTRPGPHVFTVEEFHRMSQGGVFGEDDRLELLDGHIVDMIPIGSRHAATVDRLTYLLTAAARDRAIVRVQNPIILDARSEPHPDLTLLRRRADFYAQAHPEPADVLLVIEVADATLAFDRVVKIPLYAHAGVIEAWIVDLVVGRVEIHRDPAGGRYGSTTLAGRGQSISPEALPGLVLEVSEILG